MRLSRTAMLLPIVAASLIAAGCGGDDDDNGDATTTKASGKGIEVQTFPDAGAAAAALKTDKVDVFFGDSPVVADYVNKDAEAFEFAGEPIDPLPVGIAMRKDDTELHDAVQQAINAMYADGTVEEIFSEWNVADFMLTETDEAEAGDIETPAPLEADGEFVVCTDVPYPPAEFLEGDKYVGYEIDLMNEVATRLGTTATYEKTLFDAIIPSLTAKKCDAIISSMNVTPEREEQVTFVEYMEIGQSLMVRKGEGEGIEDLDDLDGKSVAVQVGTTLKDALDEKSAELKGEKD